MRVLHLSPEYPPQKVYGLGRFVHDLSRAQALRGDRVTVVTNSLGGEDDGVVRDGVRICRIEYPPPPKPPLTETQVLQFNVSVIARALSATAREGRWDVVNAHDWYLLPAAYLLRKHFDIPLCLTVHDTIVGKSAGELADAQKFIANVEMWGCRTAERVVCCSGFMRDEVLDRYGAAAERVSVIPCGVDERTFESRFAEHLAAFREVIANPDEKIILYVGRLDPEKGVDLLLDAIPSVIRREPRAKFVILGTGRLEEHVRGLARSERTGEHVVYLGYVGRAPLTLLYRCAEIQVVPSTYEPFGIVALEGMLNGLGMVVSDTTGLAEIVEHEVDGLQFTTGSAQHLAEAVLRLLSDRTLLRDLAQAGRGKARDLYSWRRIARLTAGAYREATAVRENPP